MTAEPDLTPERVARCLADVVGDIEVNHWTEDGLMLGILKVAAEDPTRAQALAVAFLNGYDPDRDRYYS